MLRGMLWLALNLRGVIQHPDAVNVRELGQVAGLLLSVKDAVHMAIVYQEVTQGHWVQALLGR